MSEIQHAVVTQMEEGRKERVNRLYSMINRVKLPNRVLFYAGKKEGESHISSSHMPSHTVTLEFETEKPEKFRKQLLSI